MRNSCATLRKRTYTGITQIRLICFVSWNQFTFCFVSSFQLNGSSVCKLMLFCIILSNNSSTARFDCGKSMQPYKCVVFLFLRCFFVSSDGGARIQNFVNISQNEVLLRTGVNVMILQVRLFFNPFRDHPSLIYCNGGLEKWCWCCHYIHCQNRCRSSLRRRSWPSVPRCRHLRMSLQHLLTNMK